MKLTENCYAVLGLGYVTPWTVNAGIITGAKTTLVVDSGPTYLAAQTIYGYAKNIKPENNLVVINTEQHLDHIGGNCLFRENGIKIYGHNSIQRTDSDLIEDMKYFNKSIFDDTRRNLGEEKIFYEGTTIVNPDYVVSNQQTFDLDGRIKAKIIYTFGHTSSNISIYIPSEKVLYCGDCLVSGYQPNLDCGSIEDWKKWLNSLDIITELDVDFVVPGHGKVLKGREIEKTISYIKTVLNESILKTQSI